MKKYTFNIGQALKVVAAKKQIHLRDIAKAINVSPSALSMWNKRERIDIFYILAICNSYDITVEEFISYGH